MITSEFLESLNNENLTDAPKQTLSEAADELFKITTEVLKEHPLFDCGQFEHSIFFQGVCVGYLYSNYKTLKTLEKSIKEEK